MDDEHEAAFEDGWNAGWQAAVEAVRTFLVDVDTMAENVGPSRDTAVTQDDHKQHETARNSESRNARKHWGFGLNPPTSATP